MNNSQTWLNFGSPTAVWLNIGPLAGYNIIHESLLAFVESRSWHSEHSFLTELSSSASDATNILPSHTIKDYFIYLPPNDRNSRTLKGQIFLINIRTVWNLKLHLLWLQNGGAGNTSPHRPLDSDYDAVTGYPVYKRIADNHISLVQSTGGPTILNAKYLFKLKPVTNYQTVHLNDKGDFIISKDSFTPRKGQTVICESKPDLPKNLTWASWMDSMIGQLMRIEVISPTGILKCSSSNGEVACFCSNWVSPVYPLLKDIKDWSHPLTYMDVHAAPYLAEADGKDDPCSTETKKPQAALFSELKPSTEQKSHAAWAKALDAAQPAKLSDLTDLKNVVQCSFQEITILQQKYQDLQQKYQDLSTAIKQEADLRHIECDANYRSIADLYSTVNDLDSAVGATHLETTKQIKASEATTKNLEQQFEDFQKLLGRYFLASPDERSLIHERVLENRRYSAIETCFKWGTTAAVITAVITSVLYYLT